MKRETNSAVLSTRTRPSIKRDLARIAKKEGHRKLSSWLRQLVERIAADGRAA
jgi:hypothetical protein